jgi:uncharacterized membrane protein YphA (DoxX/SURF4 family)
MPSYPMVNALVKHGGLLAAVVAVGAVGSGIYLAIALNLPLLALAGVVVGAVAYALLKSYAELVAIIADMMLPK